MPKTLISQFPTQKREARQDGSSILNISELFCDTIQGEGSTSGTPSTFIRLQHCTLACVWCDTLEVWKQGNPYSVEEVLDMFEDTGMIDKFKGGQHIILTGGSPLLQQDALLDFCRRFVARFDFHPHIEVENECMLMPKDLALYIQTWNNSPKLSNSGMRKQVRYKPDIISHMASLSNSTFKFVVSAEEDWQEILEDFIHPGLIKKEQIILMPEGQDRLELQRSYDATVAIAIRHNVKMCDRLHITMWNKKVGV